MWSEIRGPQEVSEKMKLLYHYWYRREPPEKFTKVAHKRAPQSLIIPGKTS